jgi:hypothetical protein
MVGSGQRLPSRDEQIGLRALGFLQQNHGGLVILIDDLEPARRTQVQIRYPKNELPFQTALACWTAREGD